MYFFLAKPFCFISSFVHFFSTADRVSSLLARISMPQHLFSVCTPSYYASLLFSFFATLFLIVILSTSFGGLWSDARVGLPCSGSIAAVGQAFRGTRHFIRVLEPGYVRKSLHI